MRTVVSFILLICIISCAGNPGPVSQKPVVANSVINIGVADSLWKARADTANARKALQAYKFLASNEITALALWSKLSRAYYFYGRYVTVDPIQQDSLFMRGYEASQAILNKNAEYRELLYSTGDENMAIRGLSRNYLDALYWGMANYGQWLATKGDLVRLGQRELIWTTLEHVNDLDSTYYYGAYYRFMGALLSRDPEFQSDTTRIREAFEKAHEIAPKYLGNNTLMAAFYCPLTGDKVLFYKLLAEVLTTPVETYLPYYPENLREKIIAKRLLESAATEKWFKQ